MEREVSTAVHLGVGLIALSAFIFILWSTVFTGEDLADDAADTATNILRITQTSRLEELTEVHTVLPASAVYSILRENESCIGNVQCRICGVGSKTKEPGNGRCLLTHLGGKVSLEVRRTDFDWYELIIHKQTCDWFYNSCNTKLCS